MRLSHHQWTNRRVVDGERDQIQNSVEILELWGGGGAVGGREHEEEEEDVPDVSVAKSERKLKRVTGRIFQSEFCDKSDDIIIILIYVSNDCDKVNLPVFREEE